MHSRGIIYCDLKPSNLLVDGSGVVKLADFGLAQLVDQLDYGKVWEYGHFRKGAVRCGTVHRGGKHMGTVKPHCPLCRVPRVPCAQCPCVHSPWEQCPVFGGRMNSPPVYYPRVCVRLHVGLCPPPLSPSGPPHPNQWCNNEEQVGRQQRQENFLALLDCGRELFPPLCSPPKCSDLNGQFKNE